MVECWEDQSGRRPLTGVETHEEVREGYDEERYENRARRQKKKKKKKKKVSDGSLFLAQVENEAEYLSNTRVKVG